MNRIVFLSLLSLFCFFSQTEAGIKIYFIRHAEAGHNIVKEWNDIPEELWPAYVGNSNMFTPKGEAQVALVPQKLEKYHFDFIAVSPAWRTRQTILPYLKQTLTQATIWPELGEFKIRPVTVLSPVTQTPQKNIFNCKKKIEIPAAESDYFRLAEDGRHRFDFDQSEANELFYANVNYVLEKLIDRIHKTVGGTDKSILLVGHGNNGIGLLKLITNDNLDKMPSIKNTGIWMVEEQPDGTFKIKIYNDHVQ